MAQTGYTPILIYSSSTAAAAPTAGNLTNSTLGSELAINIADGKLFYKDSGGTVQVIGWKTVPTTAGGTGVTSYTAGDLIYYASGTAFTKLGIGSAYQALQVNAGGTAPSWQASATSTLTAQGDLLYASAANTLARLAKNTSATRYLANTGSSNNPAWAQVDLTNGVTGTLPVGNGGTGTSTAFTAGSVVFAGTSGVYTQDNANLFWDDTNNKLGIGTTTFYSGTSANLTAASQIDVGLSATAGVSSIQFVRSATTGGIGQMYGSVSGFTNFALILLNANDVGGGSQSGSIKFYTTLNTTSTERAQFVPAGHFQPSADDTYTCGANGARWSAVWAANGTIQTSDARTKKDVEDAALGWNFIKNLRPVSYKWIVGGNEVVCADDQFDPKTATAANTKTKIIAKPGSRTHWGFIAQEVKAAVDAAGVDFGGWVLTDKDDANSEQALRYDQFIAPIVKTLQEAMTRIEALEAQVLKAKE